MSASDCFENSTISNFVTGSLSSVCTTTHEENSINWSYSDSFSESVENLETQFSPLGSLRRLPMFSRELSESEINFCPEKTLDWFLVKRADCYRKPITSEKYFIKRTLWDKI